MPLENANTIAQLDESYPLPNDPGSRGDDHLRLIKGVLKKIFPGKNGNGFSKPITIDEDFLNNLPTALANLRSDMDKRWPVGSGIILLDGTNPNGIYPGTWALLTGDASLALGNGTKDVGYLYGNNDPLVPLPWHGHLATFVGDKMPPHVHATNILGGNQTGPVRQNAPVFINTDAMLYTSWESAGTPTGNVYINGNGTPNATLNVRGVRINVNLWKRVA